jgi:hypothetical protein
MTMMGAGDAQRGMYVSPADRTDAEWARFQRVSCVSGSLSLSLSLSLSFSLCVCVCGPYVDDPLWLPVRTVCGSTVDLPHGLRGMISTRTRSCSCGVLESDPCRWRDPLASRLSHPDDPLCSDR